MAEKADIDGVLFPYVAGARSEQGRLINFCREAGIKTYITPGIGEMTEGKAVGNYVRKIKIEGLLGRPEIKISMDEIIANFSGKVIMVTGRRVDRLRALPPACHVRSQAACAL